MMPALPSLSTSSRSIQSRILGAALIFGLLGACSDEQAKPATTQTPPTTCEPESTTLRSLDGWSQCCEDGSEPTLPRDGSLMSCALEGEEGDAEPAGGAGGAAGAPGASLAGAGGVDSVAEPPWVVITRPFEAEWDGGSEVCLHMTSKGDAVSGDITLFTLSSSASCQVPVALVPRPFTATESATAYLCLNRNAPPLASPGPGGEIAVAFRFRQGAPEGLRVDAIDVHQDTCTP